MKPIQKAETLPNVAFLSDEDFNGRVVRGLIRREPFLDLVRVQDMGLSGLHERQVLAWVATEQRLLLTHDAATMTKYAYERRLRACLRQA